ncbi:PAS domain-containing protein [Rubrivivax sp. RP6-9]|uniref:sensor histidine kinase n=1 Tax=Rubrivivax sp. RP6-9 TaxID=3415750 RepID=UPI003CC663DF
MRSRDDPPAAALDDSFASLFDFLPIGAYRAQPDGRLLRANAALVRLNDCASEDELHARAQSIDSDWYVDPARRDQFRALLFRDGQVRAFVSQVRLLVSRRLIWVSETAHLVHDAQGRLLYYEGTVEEVTERIEAAAALQRSEQQLREIAARVPGVVYRLHVAPDGTRRFTFVSEGVQALYGVRPEDVLADGELLRSFDHPADHLRVSLETEASRRSGQPVQTEFRIVLADGTQKWVQLAASSVASDAQGHIRVGVMMDISARKQAELALRGSEERWTLALDSLGDGVWDWDIARGREVVSARLLEMYGLTREAHRDRPEALDALTHPDDRAQMQADREAHFSGRTASYMNEHRMRCSDGRWKWILSRGMVIERDAAGQPLRMIGTHTDISARKEAEALRQERDRGAAAQKAQSAFLSRVSHELRTPMNAIIGFAQLLEMDQAGNERQRAWVQTILESGRHLLALVNDLLDLSSAETGQLQFTRTAVDLAQLLREAWAMHAAEAHAAGLRFVDALPAEPLSVQGDPTRLKQVASNLLSNAIKYNRPGGQVLVGAARFGDVVTLSVSDTGQGMDTLQLARLFTPFERAGAQHSPVAGTGLGLALAKQLVEAMGGAITVHSKPGQGSVFSVTLKTGVADAGSQGPAEPPDISAARI